MVNFGRKTDDSISDGSTVTELHVLEPYSVEQFTTTQHTNSCALIQIPTHVCTRILWVKMVVVYHIILRTYICISNSDSSGNMHIVCTDSGKCQ